MRFARVSGTIIQHTETSDPTVGSGQLIVTLDSGHRVRTVREEVVSLLPSADASTDLAWSADQYTQETIAVDLAEEGWEVIGTAAIELEASAPLGTGASAIYLVRLMSDPAGAVSGTDDGR